MKWYLVTYWLIGNRASLFDEEIPYSFKLDSHVKAKSKRHAKEILASQHDGICFESKARMTNLIHFESVTIAA